MKNLGMKIALLTFKACPAAGMKLINIALTQLGIEGRAVREDNRIKIELASDAGELQWSLNVDEEFALRTATRIIVAGENPEAVMRQLLKEKFANCKLIQNM